MTNRKTYGPSVIETKKYPKHEPVFPDWKHLFRPAVLKKAETEKIECMKRWHGLMGEGRNRRTRTVIDDLPTEFGTTFDRNTEFRCTCGQPYCSHEAAVMLWYEKEYGPVVQEEQDYEYARRVRREKGEDLLKELRKHQEEDGKTEIPALPFFSDLEIPSGIVRFDVEGIAEACRTTDYHIRRANSLLENNLERVTVRLGKTREGKETLRADYYFREYEDLLDVGGTLILGPDSIINKAVQIHAASWQVSLNEKWENDRQFLNEYDLTAFYALWKYSLTLRDEDHTDSKAEEFFRNLEEQENEELFEETVREERKQCVDLLPRITIEDGEAKLSFKAGLHGGRLFVVRNLEQFAFSYNRKRVFELTKKEVIDFRTCDFSKESRKLADFVIRRVGEMNAINEKMWNKTGKELAITFQQNLTGALLDNFYDAAAGSTAEFTDKTNNVKDERISIGYTRMNFSLKVEDLLDTKGNFLGVAVSGLIPVLIHGSSSNYILNASYLSRMNREERRVLEPFRQVADASGYFRFQVGQSKLQEFYYRILPKLLNNPYVRLENECSDLLSQYLPPEPVFTFYLDYLDGEVLLNAKVAYDERTYDLCSPSNGEYRDVVQEERVERVLKKIFWDSRVEPGRYVMVPGEEELFTFLNRDLSLMEKYGSVMVSSSLSSIRTRSIPNMNFGISVKSGLLDLSLTSSELSAEELSEVLASYQKKKKYHRLKSGEFISLEETAQVQQILDVFESMNLVPDEVIRKRVHLPVFRALYLDRLLENHEAIISARDRTFRSLVKGFRTVRDADYELPAELEPVLRPYQTFGYKWLRTLASAGFGGILADEMGLGKTLQMISVFDALYQEGGRKANLVICPASLVYNWEEEIQRFAPDLRVLPLAGSTAQRKKQLKMLKEGEEVFDVYITSYDLLKRDISLYEEIPFGCCVLDEAQFIKNQKSNAAKSVKVIHSDYRFALTGTPIENRLSEMWSIFDFLMPGFLYSAKEFSTRFENPITRSHDEQATEKLKMMVSPFILRRRKEDVLTDLPAKLEEVRYAVLSGEQAKLYDAEVQKMKTMLKTGNAQEDRFKVFAELTRIREICCDPSLLFEGYADESAKRSACMELIQSAVDGGHRMLVFSQFTSMLALLESDLKEAGIPYYMLTGETSKAKRLQLVHSFNEEGEVPVFLISLKAGGTGLNLTGADVVIHYDPWWNLAATNQATDRAHRIGQEKQVTVYKMIARGTIEEKIMDLQNAKQDLAEAVLAGSADTLMTLTPEELLALLN